MILVTIKLIELKIDDTPAICKDKIKKSTLILFEPSSLLKGGQIVHPVPGPKSIIILINNNHSLNGISQNENLFNRGKIKSGQISIIGIIQLPKPPINAGITIKKIINKACLVTTELQKAMQLLLKVHLTNDVDRLIRINILSLVPNIAAQILEIKYREPIFL